MAYTVSTVKALTLNETDRTKSILQNISIILRTCMENVPLFRQFGMPYRFLDKPMNRALPILIMEVREAIEEYEPRVELLSVNFTQDASGVLIPEVEVEILEES